MKNFKKVLSLILTFVLALGTLSVVSADMSFSDLSESHWGYSYVQTLVSDGTINGYQDGTFKPEANVTRAEFVKMIGKTDKAFSVPFDDISGHWGYDYIMYSDMDVEGKMFYPDVAITRDDVIGLLWKRAGSPEAVAPSVITNQSSKPGAAAWAYAYGVMNGDDGVTMRLGDGVTRAEAAALICRSRAIDANSQKKSFADTVNAEILKTVYESSYSFDSEYEPSKTFTNGEIAGIAMKVLYESNLPKYNNLNTGISVDRPNTFAFYTACQYIWGDDRMTESFYDATANNLDAIALLTFAADVNSQKFDAAGVNSTYYDDVKYLESDGMKKYINGAFEAGIKLENGNNIYPKNSVTAKNLALILLQLDSLAGVYSTYDVSVEKITPVNVSMRTEIAGYPVTKDRYPIILSSIPNEVYNSNFIDSKGVVRTETTHGIYELARSRYDVFTNFLLRVTNYFKNSGMSVNIEFIPSMIVETDSEYIMKVKVSVNNVDAGKTFDDLFPNIISGEKPEIKSGVSFYAGLATGTKIQGLSMPIDDATFTSIDYIK